MARKFFVGGVCLLLSAVSLDLPILMHCVVELQDEYGPALQFHPLLTQVDGLLSSTKALVQTINASKFDSAVEVVVAPPALYLLVVKEHLANEQVQIAAQNVFDKPQGAYTGEIS
jgi:Triosephosphate isomerase